MSEKTEKLKRFLALVSTAGWRAAAAGGNTVPGVWNEQFREALAKGLLKIGFGGVIKLTEKGKKAQS